MSRHRTLRISLTALAVISLACATTTFQSTWKAPDARPLQLAGRKVVAVFLSKNPALRRRAEDAMTREITARGAEGIPAYTILSDEEIRDKESAKTKLESRGFNGAVVMRIVGSETQYSVEPAFWARPYYHRFWGGYWGWGWGTVWAPGYLQADRIVSVETLVYSLDQDLLVWAGVSRTIDPQAVESFIAELARAVTREMAKQGLFAKS